MPRPPRTLVPNAYYHVYNRGSHKQAIVQDNRDRKTFLDILGKLVSTLDIHLFAYCLMNNHFHFFLKTPQGNLNELMHQFQTQYVRYFNLRYDYVGSLFQGRYRSRLVQADVYATVLIRYIHQNPLEAGLVRSVIDYEWSSYPCYVGKYPSWRWLQTEWALSLFDRNRRTAVEMFQNFHHEKGPEQERRELSSFAPVLSMQ